MHTAISNRGQSRVLICALLAVTLALPSLNAQGRRKNPTSKVYIADVEGSAQIDTGETINDLTKRSVYTAQGTVIETKENATNSMVWSNGTGIYFDPNTRLEVRKFVQEPFTPNRKDMEVEPSISNTETFLSRGLVGLCTSKLVAGTTMKYNTPHASVRVKGGKAVIESNDQGTTISLLEGDVTVRVGELDTGGQTLHQGQQAVITPSGGMTIQDIPKSQASALDDKVTIACMARKTVYFESKDKDDAIFNPNDVTAFDETGAGEEDNLVPIEVTPTEPVVPVSPASVTKTTTP